MNIEKALDYAYPGTLWTLEGTGYNGLVWMDPTVPKPSKKALEKAHQDYEKSGLDYQEKRAADYKRKELSGDLPSNIEEQFDELWKALEAAEINGTELPPSASSIIRHRRAVKNKHPKPKANK